MTDQIPPPPPFAPGAIPPPPTAGVPPPPPTTPPPTGFGTPPGGGAGDSSPRGSRRTVAIAIAAVVAVAGGAAVAWAVTRDDSGDDPTSDRTERTDRSNRSDRTDPDETTEDSDPPDSTEPQEATTTTRASTTTTSPPTTAPPSTIPSGAIDLGNGTYIPVPAGWERTTAEDEVVTLSDGVTRLTIQTLARTPGEEPLSLAQEYVDLFDADFTSVSYSPAFQFDTYNGVVPARSFGLYYRTFDDDGSSLSGGLYLFQRTDGLSVIYDVWSDASAESGAFPDDEFNIFLDSYLDAPQVDDPVPFADIPPFRVTSSHPFATLEGLVGYSVPPSFSMLENGAGYAVLSNGVVDVYTNALGGLASAEDALAAVQASLQSSREGLVFDPPTVHPMDANGIVQVSASFTGPYPDGRSAAGGLDVFWNSASGKAYSFARLWVATEDGVEPFDADTTYIYQSVYDAVSAEVAAAS